MTKTDNELIAEFMGIHVRYQGQVLYRCDEDGYIDFVDGADTYSPHVDWSDLMPVVEKIESLGHNVAIEGMGCVIFKNYGVPVSQTGNWPTKIQATYEAVKSFIKWFNQQKKES